MRKDRLLDLLQNPELLDPVKDLGDLKDLTRNYPYFSPGHGLTAAALHTQRSIYTGDYIKVASLYTGDRQVLRELVEQRDRLPGVVRKAALTLREIQGAQPDVMPGTLPEIEVPSFPEAEPGYTPGTQPTGPEIAPDEQPGPERQMPHEPVTYPQPDNPSVPETIPEPEPGTAPGGSTEASDEFSGAGTNKPDDKPNEKDISERDKQVDNTPTTDTPVPTLPENEPGQKDETLPGEEGHLPQAAAAPDAADKEEQPELHVSNAPESYIDEIPVSTLSAAEDEEIAKTEKEPGKASESDEGYEPLAPPQEPVNPSTTPEPRQHPTEKRPKPGDPQPHLDPKDPHRAIPPQERNEPIDKSRYSVLAGTDYFAYLEKVSNKPPFATQPQGNIAQRATAHKLSHSTAPRPDMEKGSYTFLEWIKIYGNKEREWEATPETAHENADETGKEPKPGLSNTPDSPEAPDPSQADKPDLLDKLNAIEWPPKTKRAMYKPVEMARLSDEEDVNLVSETLANIYINQKLYSKAIETFQRLILRNPEKTAYFAGRIVDTKALAND